LHYIGDDDINLNRPVRSKGSTFSVKAMADNPGIDLSSSKKAATVRAGRFTRIGAAH